jgi:hypothetical protein
LVNRVTNALLGLVYDIVKQEGIAEMEQSAENGCRVRSWELVFIYLMLG